MSKPTELKVMVLHESIFKSLVTDAGTFALAVAIMLVARWTGVTAFEWIGALIFFMTLFHSFGRKQRFSLDEAQAELDRLRAKIQKDTAHGEE